MKQNLLAWLILGVIAAVIEALFFLFFDFHPYGEGYILWFAVIYIILIVIFGIGGGE